MALLSLAVVGATGARAAPRLEPDDLPPPQLEVDGVPARVELPAVPSFELPPQEPGFHRPRELRVRGAQLLGTEIQVKGYVTAVYDCAAVLAATHPGTSRAELLQSIDHDPRQCDRPRFYLGDAPGPHGTAIAVVEVPRPPAKPERDALSTAELAQWPAVPRVTVGDYLVVTGTWATASPHGERDTRGLLVYKALEPARPGAAGAGTGAPAALAPAARPSAPEITVATKPPLRALIDNPRFNASIDHLNACTRANRAGQPDAALTECAAAVRIWSDNHLAWYGAASAHIAKLEWPEAQAAALRAVTLRPDVAMYQLYYGMSLYEAMRARSRSGGASVEQAGPSAAAPDASGLEAARDALRRAVKLAPSLWRAHAYLGRIDDDLGDARGAAEQLTQAIASHPSYRPSYLALIELYRRWDDVDQALAVAILGTKQVPAGAVAELWYEAGMAYGAKRADTPALEAFTRALAGNPGSTRARFGRAQIYLRRADLAHARADLEEVSRSPDPELAELRAIAAQSLAQIAHKQGLGVVGCPKRDSCIPDKADPGHDRK